MSADNIKTISLIEYMVFNWRTPKMINTYVLMFSWYTLVSDGWLYSGYKINQMFTYTMLYTRLWKYEETVYILM